MPQSIILCPPGGFSGIFCWRYTTREKIAIIFKIRRIKRQTNVSYCQAAATIGVCHTLVFRWHAIRECYNINIKMLPCYSAYHSPCGQLESVKEELLVWIFKRRETGLVVSTLSVIIKANGPGGKNVIFSNCPYDQSKYPDPLIYVPI